jgi:hypothetical protein
MPSSFELPADIHSKLMGERQLNADSLALIEITMNELIEVAAGVGRDYDEAEGDYANLAALVCSGRTRNRVARRIRSREVPDDVALQAFGSGSAITLCGGGTWIHPYSAGGADAPLLAGSVTKERIYSEGVAQLALFEELEEEGRPLHVVIAYSRDLEGVISAKVGVMSGREEFAWEEPIYARVEDEIEVSISGEPEVTGPTHDEQHVPDPPLKLRPRRDERDDEL